MTCGVSHDVAGFALGDDLGIGCADNLVPEPQRTSSKLRNVRANEQFVVVVGWRLVTAIAFGYNQKSVFVLFHVAIGEIARATEFSSADLKPNEVIGVINNPHLVSFGVTHAQECLVPLSEHIFGRRACHMNESLQTLSERECR